MALDPALLTAPWAAEETGVLDHLLEIAVLATDEPREIVRA
jgi:hypothetical protein